MLFFASVSSTGVTGREYPRKPTWSARRQSTVTNTRERFFMAVRCGSRIDLCPVSLRDDDLAAESTHSNVAQISEALFNNLFFSLVKLACVVFGYFLEEKTEQRFEAIKSTRQGLLCRRTQILGQIDRPVLGHLAFTPFICMPPRSCNQALRAIIRSSGSRAYATAKPPNTIYDRASDSRIASHG